MVATARRAAANVALRASPLRARSEAPSSRGVLAARPCVRHHDARSTRLHRSAGQRPRARCTCGGSSARSSACRWACTSRTVGSCQTRPPVLLPIATLLNGIGYVEIARWNHTLRAVSRRRGPRSAPRSTSRPCSSSDGPATSTATATCCCSAAIVLLLAPARPALRARRSTARGSGCTSALRQFQPVEIAKLLLVIFFASYFATTKELLSRSPRAESATTSSSTLDR